MNASRQELAGAAPAPEARSALEPAIRRAEEAGASDAPLPAPLRAAVAQVIGPLLTVFVDWVLRDARERGLERLCFVSRDGQVLLRIAELLVRRRPGPACSYLFGSRQAWFLPSLALAPSLAPDWMLLPGQSTAPRAVLRRLAIECEEVRDQLAAHGVDQGDWSREVDRRDLPIYGRLLADPVLAALVRTRAERARETTLAYLAQEGLHDGTPWALVDVGWTLKTQAALRALLRAAGGSGPALGYYLALLSERASESDAGPARAFVDEREAPGMRPFFRNTPVIEQLFTIADHGSVRGYEERDGRYVPTLDERALSPERRRFAVALQEEIVRFAAAYLDEDLDRAELGPLRAAALAAANRFLARPPADAVRAVAALEVGDDQNEARRVPIATPLGFGALAAMLLRRLRLLDASRYRRSFAWLEGSLALSGRPVRALAPLVSAAETASARAKPRSADGAVG